MTTETVQFRSVAQFMSGGTPSKKRADFWQGSIPWVSPKDMKNHQIADAEDHISDIAISGSATKLVPPGTILVVTRSGILARKWPVGMVTAEVAFNQDIKAISVDRERVEPEFAFWWLRSREGEVLHRGVKKGATVHSLLAGFVEDMEIPLPPLDEQWRVVGILNRAAGIERLRAEAREKLRAFIPALFVRMFGDPVENPMGWEVRPLGDVLLSIEGGWSPKCGNGRPGRDEWGVLKLSAVTGGWYDDREAKVFGPDLAHRPGIEVASGDLLFSRKNTKDLVGACAWATETAPMRMFPDTVFRLNPDTDFVHAGFLWAYFNQPAARPAIERIATGAAASMLNISKGRLREMLIPVPPIDLQVHFAEIVTSARGITTTADTASATAAALSASLMARLFGDAGADTPELQDDRVEDVQ